MGYSEAMELAGAKVLAYQEFGSYQGDWYAKVSFSGQEFWVHGSFGSCSGCDAFQGEFGYGQEKCEEHRYDYTDHRECTACASTKQAYDRRLAEFGLSYLQSGDMTDAEAIVEATRNDWDSNSAEMEAFIRQNAIDPESIPPARRKIARIPDLCTPPKKPAK